jgi:hypothetical protein
MSATPSASRLGKNLLEFLKIRHGDELQCRDVHRFEILEKHAPNGYLELFADVGNALDDLLGLLGSGDGHNIGDIPKCMYKRNLCGLHRQTCLDFVGSCGSDGHEELLSSCESTDETDHNLPDDMAAGLNDDLDGNSNEDEDDENDLSADARDLAEYDREEVIWKDQVSQHRRQRVKIDEDDVKTLVSVSDDDDRAESMIDSPQRGSVSYASRATPKCTRKYSSRSPSTPKNTPSFLRRYSDKDSAQKTLYYGHYKNSPSYRTLRTVTTLSADPSYDEDVEVNEEAVRQRIKAPIVSKGHNPAYGKAGFVYAFRDNELPLIKIGYTTKKLEERKSAIEKSCGYINSMTLVAAVEVKAYKRLEEIIHQDLAPHRRFFDCACGGRNKHRFTRHQEYFEIDDKTALITLQLWADFVERQPWERNPRPQQGTDLKSNWYDKLLKPSRVEPSETHDSHDDRVKRWRKFLDIPFPEVEFEFELAEAAYTTRLAMRSTAENRNDITGFAESFKPDYTPSKPPRPATEDTDETNESVKPNFSFAESLERSSSSNELTDLPVQEFHRTAHEFTTNLPYRTKDGEPTSNDTAATPASSLQAESISNGTTVSPNGKRSSSILPGVRKAQQNTGGSSEKIHDEAPSVPTAQTDLEKTHQSQSEARPSDTVSSASQKILNNAIIMSASPLMQSMTELATCLLAKEVRPLPARAISADIWQFRWPLACSIAFALHSPHIPAGLSFLMWSVFLPFFVAELRGWAVVGRA